MNVEDLHLKTSESYRLAVVHSMKLILSNALLLLAVFSAQAQHVVSADGIDHYNKTKRWVVDKANLDIFYQIKFLTDSTKTNDVQEGQTVLRLSDKYALFTDYYRIVHDSINDLCAESRKMQKSIKLHGTLYPLNAVICSSSFHLSILKSLWLLFSGEFYEDINTSNPFQTFSGDWKKAIRLFSTNPVKKPLVRMPVETMWHGIPTKSICPMAHISSAAFPD